VKPVATQLGQLNLLSGACEQQIGAELRGLSLLIDIVNQSPNWGIENHSERPFLVSRDGAPGISVDIFESMKARILGGDPHLKISMAMKEVCVLRKESDVLTPSTDSMVSLVLLGNMDWPLSHTPTTLKKKSIAQKELPREFIADDIYYNETDHRAIEASQEEYAAGRQMNAISLVGAMARRWYVCREWPFEIIRPLIGEVLADYDPVHVRQYIENPQCSDDDLFIQL